jgi:hypothetical protein
VKVVSGGVLVNTMSDFGVKAHVAATKGTSVFDPRRHEEWALAYSTWRGLTNAACRNPRELDKRSFLPGRYSPANDTN